MTLRILGIVLILFSIGVSQMGYSFLFEEGIVLVENLDMEEKDKEGNEENRSEKDGTEMDEFLKPLDCDPTNSENCKNSNRERFDQYSDLFLPVVTPPPDLDC